MIDINLCEPWTIQMQHKNSVEFNKETRAPNFALSYTEYGAIRAHVICCWRRAKGSDIFCPSCRHGEHPKPSLWKNSLFLRKFTHHRLSFRAKLLYFAFREKYFGMTSSEKSLRFRTINARPWGSQQIASWLVSSPRISIRRWGKILLSSSSSIF